MTRAALLLAFLVATAEPARAHPLHTTLTELSYDARARVLGISVRVFVDDFSAAVTRGQVARPAGALPPDSAMLRYVAARLVVAVPGGRPTLLRWCGARRAGDVVFLCLRAEGAGPLAGTRVRNALLTEVFADQVNIVQASAGGRRQMLLFTPRDGMKALR